MVKYLDTKDTNRRSINWGQTIASVVGIAGVLSLIIGPFIISYQNTLESVTELKTQSRIFSEFKEELSEFREVLKSEVRLGLRLELFMENSIADQKENKETLQQMKKILWKLSKEKEDLPPGIDELIDLTMVHRPGQGGT